MPEFARVESGVVRERRAFERIDGLFHPDVLVQWHQCPPEVVEGYLFDGSVYSPPPAPVPEQPPAELAAFIAILSKADADITAGEVKAITLALGRRALRRFLS